MCKKVLIAALAVVVGLAVIRGTKPGSYLRLWANKAVCTVKESIPPEQEIARLRMELKGLERDDDQHYDRVARMTVAVQNMEREVATFRAKLGKEEASIRKVREELSGNVEFVLFEGSRYTRDDLRTAALEFKTAEEALKSKEENLQAKRKHLALEKKKLTELRTTREQMGTDLQRLETALAEERHAQAASESTIDDSNYRRLSQEMKAVRDRIEVLKEKRKLRGELRVPTKDDQTRQRDVQADKFLDSRFGKNKEVVGGNDD